MSNDERTDHSVSSQPSSSKSGSGLSNSRPNYSLNNQNSPWFLKKQTLKRRFQTSFSGNQVSAELQNKKSRVSKVQDERFTIPEIQNLFEQDVLSQQIRRYFNENTQQDWFLQRKWDLAKALQTILNEGSILRCEVFIVGSSVNGFGRFNSDCDMCVVVDKNSTTLSNSKVMQILDQVRRLLRHASFVRNLKLIPAKVRILKFRDCKSDMECDLNVNNLTGLRNTQLMYAYAQQDPRVKPLILCIKEWAHQNDINDASVGTLSSYALVLMVLHFLQYGVRPCVVPSLQQRFPSHFSATIPVDEIEKRAKSIPYTRSSNRQSLSDLLIGFFRYYSKFDFEKVISIRLAECFPVNELRHGVWHRKCIRIEEPFDQSNVARAVRNENFNRILSCFKQASTRLKPDGKLRDLMHITRRSRQTAFDWKLPNFIGQ